MLNLILITLFLVSLFIYTLPRPFISFLQRIYPTVIFFNESNDSLKITIDDVPSKSFRDLLAVIDRKGLKVLFFVIGSYVNEENEHLLISAIKNGHELGNHGFYDRYHILLSTKDLVKEILDCDNVIDNLYRKASLPIPKTRYYRPGCGFFNQRMINIIKEFFPDIKIMLGSIYPHDPQVRFFFINYLYLFFKKKYRDDILILHDRPWTVPLINYLHWVPA
jgi:peptidoglycan/xylan/chitin deacetylase (PgdA/CDA1 family)